MRIFIRDKFKKSVPEDKKNLVTTKLIKFIDELRVNNFDIREISNGFSVWKLNRNIYKLRIDSSNRILFTFLSDTKGIRYEDNGLLILDYCSHDEQIHRINNIDLDVGYIETDEFENKSVFYDEIDENYINLEEEYHYDTSTNITSIYDSNNISDLFKTDKKETIYYLSDEQEEILNKNLPIFLFGSAGSGKTTVGIRKIYSLYSTYEGNIGYFTYSSILKKETKEMFKYLVKKEEKIYDNKKIKFFDINNYLLDNNNVNNLVRFEEFKDWYYSTYLKYSKNKKYEAFEIYREIRGILKGFIDINWNISKINKILDKKTYFKSMPKKFQTFSDKEYAYDVCEKYQAWLDENNKFDENDLSYFLIKNLDKLEKFEFILIDEIQDLTEKQIYLLYKLVKNPKNIFLSGDFNQTVNANYFDTHRIKTLFYNDRFDIKFNQRILCKNFRSVDKIVNILNELTKIKQSSLGKSSNDYFEEFINFNQIETQKPILLKKSNANEKELLLTANDRHYVSIIVSSEKTKEDIKHKYNVDSNVFTVSEIKGIENDYVVCYNMISDFYNFWKKIIQKIDSQNSHIYRYYFNLFYVAITRARQYICFYEENECEIYDLLEDYIEKVDYFDLEVLNFEKTSNREDYYNEAKIYEKNGKYLNAIKFYQRSKILDYKECIKRCEGYELFEKGKFEEASSILFEFNVDDLALRCFREIKDEKSLVISLLNSNRSYLDIQKICEQINFNFIDSLFNSIKEEDYFEKFYEIYNAYISDKLIVQEENNKKVTEIINSINSLLVEG